MTETTKRRRGAQPGNTNRLIHGRRANRLNAVARNFLMRADALCHALDRWRADVPTLRGLPPAEQIEAVRRLAAALGRLIHEPVRTEWTRS